LKCFTLGLLAVLALCPGCQSTPTPESTDAAKIKLGSWAEPGSTPKTLPVFLTDLPWKGDAAAVDLHMLQNGFTLMQVSEPTAERPTRVYSGSIPGAEYAAIGLLFWISKSTPKVEEVRELKMYVPVSGRLFDAYRDVAWELEHGGTRPRSTATCSSPKTDNGTCRIFWRNTRSTTGWSGETSASMSMTESAESNCRVFANRSCLQ
jgi:hypothetical protein